MDIKSYVTKAFSWINSLPKKILMWAAVVILCVIGFVIFNSYFSSCITNFKNRHTKTTVPQNLPRVDYSLDRNWLTCIFRRLDSVQRDGNAMTGKEMIAQCDEAFSKK